LTDEQKEALTFEESLNKKISEEEQRLKTTMELQEVDEAPILEGSESRKSGS